MFNILLWFCCLIIQFSGSPYCLYYLILSGCYFGTVYPKKYAHGFCFAVLCCGYTLTDFPISIRLTSLALWQSNDCPSASKATLMNMDKYFMWIHYERLHNHNKAKHNKTVCIFLRICCTWTINARSLGSSDAYVCRRQPLIQKMACRLFCVKPLSGLNASVLSIRTLGTKFSDIEI